MIVAEQIVAALEGGVVTNAVNIPVVDAADLEVLGPFIPLASKLGRLAAELHDGWPKRVAVAAYGPLSEKDTRLLTVAALNGLFQSRVDHAVNYVNAPVIAAERGIEVVEERFSASRDYTNTVEVRADDVAVSGTTIGPEPRLFLASAFGFAIDIEIEPYLVFLRYSDMPGVIGRVGTMFGEAGVNIANMAVSRTHEAGKALMAFAIDAPAPPDVVDRIHAEGFDDAGSSRRRTARLRAEPPARETWPEPVERVSAPRSVRPAPRRASRSSPRDADRRGRRRRRGCELRADRQVALFDCDGRAVLVLVPGDRRADRRRSPRVTGAATAKVAGRRSSSRRRQGSRRAASRRSGSQRRPTCPDRHGATGRGVVWVGAGRSPYGRRAGGRAGPSLARRAGRRVPVT